MAIHHAHIRFELNVGELLHTVLQIRRCNRDKFGIISYISP